MKIVFKVSTYNNSKPRVINNQIIDPLQNGIHGVTSSNEVEIYDNVIKKNTDNPQYKQFQGIWFETNSLAFIAHNDIEGFYWGMYFGGTSEDIFLIYTVVFLILITEPLIAEEE